MCICCFFGLCNFSFVSIIEFFNLNIGKYNKRILIYYFFYIENKYVLIE